MINVLDNKNWIKYLPPHLSQELIGKHVITEFFFFHNKSPKTIHTYRHLHLWIKLHCGVRRAFNKLIEVLIFY